jgi:hypothetical protein
MCEPVLAGEADADQQKDAQQAADSSGDEALLLSGGILLLDPSLNLVRHCSPSVCRAPRDATDKKVPAGLMAGI